MEQISAAPAPSPAARRDQELREAARSVEAAFLTEVLKSARIAEARSDFGGGAGEDQFASLLQAALAEEIVDTGGFGIAEQVYRQLRGRSDGQ